MLPQYRHWSSEVHNYKQKPPHTHTHTKATELFSYINNKNRVLHYIPCTFSVGQFIITSMVAQFLNRRPRIGQKRQSQRLFNNSRCTKITVIWYGAMIHFMLRKQVEGSDEFLGLCFGEFEIGVENTAAIAFC